jgi:hypothetical protein
MNTKSASDRLTQDVERFGRISLATGFMAGLSVGMVLASAFWLWLTWGAK